MIDNFDILSMYFGRPFQLGNGMVIKVPTIKEIIDTDEHSYYSTVHALSAIPSDRKAELFLKGLDYEKVSDFELFSSSVRSFKYEATKLLFGEIQLAQFVPRAFEETGEMVLLNPVDRIVITERDYEIIVSYIRLMHGLVPKREFGTNQYTKQFLIDEAVQKLKKQEQQPEQQQPSILLPLISSMLNSPGFKYNKWELEQVNIYEFMDSVRRISAIKAADTLSLGCYCGKIDMSKLTDKKALDWMRDLTKLEQKTGTTVNLG